MKIKINDKILCLPPFISTTWDQVRSLKIELESLSGREVLVISLIDGHLIKLVDLGVPLTEAIFNAHLKYLDNVTRPEAPKDALTQILEKAKNTSPGPFGLEGFSALLHHNPEQASLAPLPVEMLEKVIQAAKTITPQEAEFLPKPEANCNCLHCQMARALQQAVALHDEMSGEEIKAEELTFRTWDIIPIGDNLYEVRKTESPQELHNVFLGSPVGCTCGVPHCEHIRAVLNS